MPIEKLPSELNPGKFHSINELMEYIFLEHADLPAFSCFGHTLSFSDIDCYSNQFANYLIEKTDLVPGDRIAIQLPNLLQFPVVFYGACKAGLVVVNTNPLYTAKEMAHQFIDSEVKAIVILANFCDKLSEIIDSTQIRHVIVSQVGDMQPALQRYVMNLGARYIKRMVPPYKLPGSVKFTDIFEASDADPVLKTTSKGNDVAVLLYTGGTTGAAKGAMLTHNNLVANTMQLWSRCRLIIRERCELVLAPLPLYHSYAFLFHCLAMPFAGNQSLLVTNPRDLDSLLDVLRKNKVTGFVGINTLYAALLRHKDIDSIDFSNMRFSGAGGMPLNISTANEWQKLTATEVFEGYGLTECSPVVSINPPGKTKPGSVGPPLPETEIQVVSDDGEVLSHGERGELWVKGPQLMAAYWKQDEKTADAITSDGWFKTGDYVEVDADHYIKIVDRKKDMILVSGFNVFPSEIEEVVNTHPKVAECAAIGVPNEKTGESIKLFVVKKTGELSEQEIISYCRQSLTSYKIPREVVFTEDLPKSNIGKILRRELRDK